MDDDRLDALLQQARLGDTRDVCGAALLEIAQRLRDGRPLTAAAAAALSEALFMEVERGDPRRFLAATAPKKRGRPPSRTGRMALVEAMLISQRRADGYTDSNPAPGDTRDSLFVRVAKDLGVTDSDEIDREEARLRKKAQRAKASMRKATK